MDSIDLPERTAEAAVLVTICVTAVIGNISLWIIIVIDKGLRTLCNCFVLCLSGADILVSMVTMPVTVSSIIYGEWPFSQTACVAIAYLCMTLFITSVLSLAMISINRYVMIRHPAKYNTVYSKKSTGLFIAGKYIPLHIQSNMMVNKEQLKVVFMNRWL